MTGTAVETRGDKRDALRQEFQQKWLPDLATMTKFGFTPDRLLGAMLEATVKNPDILLCTRASLYRSLMRCMRWRLDIGDGVHLVPFNVRVSKKGEPDRWEKQCEAVPDYRGLIALAQRQRVVRHITAHVVWAGDEFDYELGLSPYLKHRPCSQSKRGLLVGAYALISIPAGEKLFHFMPIEDVEARRAKSQSWGPDRIKICPPWYAMKTVVRDWLNRQPKSGALGEAVSIDDAEVEMIDSESGEVIPPTAAHRQLSAGEDLSRPPASLEDDLELDRQLIEREGR